MLKYVVVLVIVIAALFGGWYTLNTYIYDAKQGGVEDYKQITVAVDGEPVTIGAEGTQFFGNEAKGDINDDGTPDLAFLITRQTGGSGTFYYAVGALQNPEGRYIGTNAVFLGDRIAPQSTEIRNGIVVVNYADRKPGEPMVMAPSVGVSAYIYYEGGALRAEWPISLFYYNPDLDKDANGNILCSEKGLVPVPRLMPDATVDTVIRALIAGKVSDGEKARGVTTEFPLDGFALVSSRMDGGTLVLTFSDPQNKTTGGSCRVGILWAQISETAKQFTGASEVRFEPEELFQP